MVRNGRKVLESISSSSENELDRRKEFRVNFDNKKKDNDLNDWDDIEFNNNHRNQKQKLNKEKKINKFNFHDSHKRKHDSGDSFSENKDSCWDSEDSSKNIKPRDKIRGKRGRMNRGGKRNHKINKSRGGKIVHNKRNANSPSDDSSSSSSSESEDSSSYNENVKKSSDSSSYKHKKKRQKRSSSKVSSESLSRSLSKSSDKKSLSPTQKKNIKKSLNAEKYFIPTQNINNSDLKSETISSISFPQDSNSTIRSNNPNSNQTKNIETKSSNKNKTGQNYLSAKSNNPITSLYQFFIQKTKKKKIRSDRGPRYYINDVKKVLEEFEFKIESIRNEREAKLIDMNEGNNNHLITSYYDKKIENLMNSKNNFIRSFNKQFRYDYLRRLDIQQFYNQLPIYAKKEEFIEAFEKNDLIIAKSTAGSGKSTQLPQYLLEVTQKRILVIEPRAIAAQSVSDRVKSVFRPIIELGN